MIVIITNLVIIAIINIIIEIHFKEVKENKKAIYNYYFIAKNIGINYSLEVNLKYYYSYYYCINYS